VENLVILLVVQIYVEGLLLVTFLDVQICVEGLPSWCQEILRERFC
jgi:hypothetical protein